MGSLGFRFSRHNVLTKLLESNLYLVYLQLPELYWTVDCLEQLWSKNVRSTTFPECVTAGIFFVNSALVLVSDEGFTFCCKKVLFLHFNLKYQYNNFNFL